MLASNALASSILPYVRLEPLASSLTQATQAISDPSYQHTCMSSLLQSRLAMLMPLSMQSNSRCCSMYVQHIQSSGMTAFCLSPAKPAEAASQQAALLTTLLATGCLLFLQATLRDFVYAGSAEP